MTSEVHKVRSSFAPHLVHLSMCMLLLTLCFGMSPWKNNIYGIFDLFLMVLGRMGIFDSNTRCGQTGKIPLGFLHFAIPMIFEYCMKNNGTLPRS